MKILKAISRVDLIGRYKNAPRRFDPLTPAQRRERVEAYRKQFLELTAEPPKPKPERKSKDRWYFASDGRRWFGTATAARSLGVSESHVRQSVLEGWRCKGVWLALSAERAARAERWGRKTKTRTVYASDGRSWETLGQAAEALGIPRRTVEDAVSGRIRAGRHGVVLGRTAEEARQRAEAGKERGAA